MGVRDDVGVDRPDDERRGLCLGAVVGLQGIRPLKGGFPAFALDGRSRTPLAGPIPGGADGDPADLRADLRPERPGPHDVHVRRARGYRLGHRHRVS